PHESAARNVIAGLTAPVSRAHRAEGAGAGRLPRQIKAGELAIRSESPIPKVERDIGVVSRVVCLLDDQQTTKPAAHLHERVAVRVIPVGAGVWRRKGVVKRLALVDDRLCEKGDTVESVRQADAVPVDGRRLVEGVLQQHAQLLALPYPQLGRRTS